MALLLSGEQRTAAAVPQNPLRALAGWFRLVRQAHAKRAALETLLDLEPARLDDLGISRGDLFDALQADRPERLLHNRRARRASFWLHP